MVTKLDITYASWHKNASSFACLEEVGVTPCLPLYTGTQDTPNNLDS